MKVIACRPLSVARLLGAAFLLIALACGTARAEEAGQTHGTGHNEPLKPLRILEGDGYPVCRALLASLNSIDPPMALQNHMPLGRHPHGLSVPDWQPVTVSEHMADIHALFTERFQRFGQPLSDIVKTREQDIQGMITADLSSGQVRLEHTDIDIDNDGYVDSVYRYYAPSRYTLPPFDWKPMGWQLLVNPGNPDADPERASGGTFGSSFAGPQYWDVYRYYGKTYVTKWAGDTIFMYKTTFIRGVSRPIRGDFCVITNGRR